MSRKRGLHVQSEKQFVVKNDTNCTTDGYQMMVLLLKQYKLSLEKRLCSRVRQYYPSECNEGRRCCLFCLQFEDDAEKFGEFIHSKCGISVHYFCLLFSSGLTQTGNDTICDIVETSDYVYGFYIRDILLEFKRGLRLWCSYCQKPGATIGCSSATCKRRFHFHCGVKANVLFQYFGQFSAFCSSDRPLQEVNEVDKDENVTCRICFDDVSDKIGIDVLTTPCCINTRLHRECVQKQALSFGLYCFRCPLCNNRDDYVEEMNRMGVYIPQRDSSWETPDAYLDLLEPMAQCDIVNCQCKHGRKYNQSGTVWSISVCVFCGLSGAHVSCAALECMDSPFICDICKSVWDADSIYEKLREMGFVTADCDQFKNHHSNIGHSSDEGSPIKTRAKRKLSNTATTNSRRAKSRR